MIDQLIELLIQRKTDWGIHRQVDWSSDFSIDQFIDRFFFLFYDYPSAVQVYGTWHEFTTVSAADQQNH